MLADRFAEYRASLPMSRASSFSGAARRRGITPSSVARQIDALEAHLDTALFLRSTRVLTLTEPGQALLIRARRILDEPGRRPAGNRLHEGRSARRAADCLFPHLGRRHVIPVVATLAELHPALQVELDLTERLADPVADRLDAVIRIGEPGRQHTVRHPHRQADQGAVREPGLFAAQPRTVGLDGRFARAPSHR
jgi:DNA-binding transcriptional LysR family regulator